MYSSENYKHWKLEKDTDNILWLGFDKEGESVNSLSKEAIHELKNIVLAIDKNNTDALIIYSKKHTGFIAGADVKEFKDINAEKQASEIIQNGQDVMNHIARLSIPTIAMIDGFCFGGGCELSLACDYRIASEDVSTKIGLPEVMLGIIPGWGGTVRMVRLIGPRNAIPLIMQGRAVSSHAAKKMGLVDACVPKRQLRRTAVYFAKNKPPKFKPSWFDSLFNHQPFRNIFNYFAYKQLAAKASKDHYPAPFAVLENWRKLGVDGDNVFKQEVTTDLDLVRHPTARNLIRIFFLQEELKELAKKDDFKAKHVHVIGAGTMGGDIAAWCAFKGMKVTLQDQNYEALSPALKRAYQLFKKKLKKSELANFAMDKIIPDVNGYGVKSADIIIEAVFENLKVKQDIFKKLEQEARSDALLATNTSSIPLDEINQVLNDKSRLVGIHFFNPVPKMMLVEVVKGNKTDSNICKKACSFVGQISKLPIPVTSTPGFLVNRVLAAYMHETFILLQEGIKPEVIDSAMRKFGMPMGPVEMAEIVGLDICLSVAENISQYSNEEVPEILKAMVSKKHLGKKTNKGFYDYKNGKLVRSKPDAVSSKGVNQEQIIDRLTMRILNICASCDREKVVDNANYIDTGLIFGAGFAPFRGGPMNYLNTLGKDTVHTKLKQLEREFGERFKADEWFSTSSNEVNRGDYAKACGE